MITGVLDAAGEGVATYFAGVKRDEFFAYHAPSRRGKSIPI